jgi:hypothetical protein
MNLRSAWAWAIESKPISDALEYVTKRINLIWLRQHDENGAHTNVTALSLVVSGTITADGIVINSITVNGNAVVNGNLTVTGAIAAASAALTGALTAASGVFSGSVTATPLIGIGNAAALAAILRGRPADDIAVLQFTNNAGTVVQSSFQTNTAVSLLLNVGTTNAYDFRVASFTPAAASVASLGAAALPWTKTWGGTYVGRVVTPAALAASQNNYNPAGLATAYVLALSATGPINITGLDATGFEDGRPLVIANIGAPLITLTHEDAASTGTNRFFFYDGANRVMGNGRSCMFHRNPSLNNRWVLVGA